jgi:hypothetical protein
MARRADIDPQNEPEHDAWSETWGDRALQDLGRWLVSNGLDDEQAALTVEQTWLFYSYVALPTLHERFPMGIAAKPTTNRPAVYFYLTFESSHAMRGQEPGVADLQAVQAKFARDLAAPLAKHVNVNLGPFHTNQWWLAQRALQDPREFEFMMRVYAASQGLDYIGVFIDDLEAELRTLLDPEVVPLWLETPNVIFSGRRPAEYLDVPLDRQLRDVITRAKFNLPAT